MNIQHENFFTMYNFCKKINGNCKNLNQEQIKNIINKYNKNIIKNKIKELNINFDLKDYYYEFSYDYIYLSNKNHELFINEDNKYYIYKINKNQDNFYNFYNDKILDIIEKKLGRRESLDIVLNKKINKNLLSTIIENIYIDLDLGKLEKILKCNFKINYYPCIYLLELKKNNIINYMILDKNILNDYNYYININYDKDFIFKEEQNINNLTPIEYFYKYKLDKVKNYYISLNNEYTDFIHKYIQKIVFRDKNAYKYFVDKFPTYKYLFKYEKNKIEKLI